MKQDLLHKSDPYYANMRSDMLRFIRGNPKRILEVGCGQGNFSKNFTDVEYLGVEANAEMAARARANGINVIAGLYDDVAGQVPDGHFDLVVCNDVIEHMIDPAGFLRNVKSKLAPNGHLIASIPNIRYAPVLFDLLVHADFEYVEAGVLDYTHLHLFTRKSFTRLAEQCGWKVEASKPLNIASSKPLRKLLAKLFDTFLPGLRNMQFAVRLSPATDDLITSGQMKK